MFETVLFGSWSLTQELLPLLDQSEHPRIVNVSSGAGSHGDPMFGLTSGNAMGPAYSTAKSALNALTVIMAKELGDRYLVNAVCPGLTATFPGGKEMGARPIEDGARGIVWAATLPPDGPSGGLFRDGLPLPW
jgi:NAD(P)-dependent dehydrogenase (short-subunit alcohol dehydrogenase family)